MDQTGNGSQQLLTSGGQNSSSFPPFATRHYQLLAVIEELGRDIRPTCAGNKLAAERLKRNIINAKMLVRECIMECERQLQDSNSSSSQK